ncbi:MAG: hypothetical protein AAFR21_11590 [Pseudomonadota bacterium]
MQDYSSWGDSWGFSWGDSWGPIETEGDADSGGGSGRDERNKGRAKQAEAETRALLERLKQPKQEKADEPQVAVVDEKPKVPTAPLSKILTPKVPEFSGQVGVLPPENDDDEAIALLLLLT